jgi:hypothetical protein
MPSEPIRPPRGAKPSFKIIWGPKSQRAEQVKEIIHLLNKALEECHRFIAEAEAAEESSETKVSGE